MEQDPPAQQMIVYDSQARSEGRQAQAEGNHDSALINVPEGRCPERCAIWLSGILTTDVEPSSHEARQSTFFAASVGSSPESVSASPTSSSVEQPSWPSSTQSPAAQTESGLNSIAVELQPSIFPEYKTKSSEQSEQSESSLVQSPVPSWLCADYRPPCLVAERVTSPLANSSLPVTPVLPELLSEPIWCYGDYRSALPGILTEGPPEKLAPMDEDRLWDTIPTMSELRAWLDAINA